MSRNHFIAGLVLIPLLAQAAEFPDGASVPSAEELKQRVGDKVFNMAAANGGTMRVDYKSNGYFFVNTSWRFQGKGQGLGRLTGLPRSAPPPDPSPPSHSS
ncbi:MAG TPA: hypothetical protein PKD73_11615 [Burkholderiaceae bacterium]|nr:hypothetical protein [Burkholderiaceae bacterium]